MRAAMIVLLMAACGGPKPAPVPTNSAPPAQPQAATCNCEAVCDCHGTDDPSRDQAAAAMAKVCVTAGVTCPACPDCMAP